MCLVGSPYYPGRRSKALRTLAGSNARDRLLTSSMIVTLWETWLGEPAVGKTGAEVHTVVHNNDWERHPGLNTAYFDAQIR